MNAHFIHSGTPRSRAAYVDMARHYGQNPITRCKTIVALGGDGHMLDVLRETNVYNKPIYGMNLGTVGYLMNDYSEFDLEARIERSLANVIHPLRVVVHGRIHYAWNEVTISRQTGQAVRLEVKVNDEVRIEDFAGDGLIIATPLGSTAYNMAAGGPVIPLEANSLALTPICPFRPRRWTGAMLSDSMDIEITVLDSEKRKSMVSADSTEVRDVQRIYVVKEDKMSATLLFDPGRGMSERIMDEQFAF